MGISRDGNTEYESNEPTFEEKTARLEEEIKQQLQEDPSLLVLNGKYFSTDEATILANSSQLQSVRLLNLRDNQIGAPALKVLFTAPNLEYLEELDLSINFITQDGIQEIAESPEVMMKNLKAISLEDNRLVDEAAVVFFNAPYFSKLESLNLGWNEVGNQIAKALGANPKMNSLRILNLERNYINEEGVRDLCDGGALKNLVELNLASNKLGDPGAIALANAQALPALKTLWLTSNEIGDDGAQALGEAKSLVSLEKLYIGRNYFGESGGNALYNTKTLSQLKTLVLQEEVGNNPNYANYSRPELLRPGFN
ncbi:MAG: hypothetical protein E2O44_04690 [Nitrospina sp.]|nr:MAG: hypothetical protein E2O44_04690 [Nitrospina sp.]TDJ58121.1 MAG: hypothetical protein E2O41_06775 [Nitrospina sp.]